MLDDNMNILIVDDTQSIRRIVKNVLKELGFKNFEESENGEDAYDKLQGGGFAFAIVDWNMPVLTGIELVRKIKANDDLKDVKILMLTAEAEKERVIEAIQAGVDNYLIKPFTPESLEDKVNKIFRN